MKVVVLITLGLIVAVTAVPAPSRRRVKLPSDPSENTDTKSKELYESYLEWKETLPEGSDDSFDAFSSWVENGRPQREAATEDEVIEADLAQREQQNQYPIAGQSEDMAERELQELNQAEMKINDFDQREQDGKFPIEGETEFSQRQEPAYTEKEEEEEEDDAGEVNQREINEQFPIEGEADFSQRQEESPYAQKDEEEDDGEEVNQREQNEMFAGPLQARDEKEKSEVFDCETNSPCTADNAAKELFFFAAKDPKKFIQCSPFGNCFMQSCGEGLAWNNAFKTCH